MIRGVLLDVGGVFVIPDGAVVGAALGDASISYVERFVEAHFSGVAAVDENRSRGDDLGAYLRSYAEALSADHVDRAATVLAPLWQQPSVNLWRTVVDGSIEGIRSLADKELRLGIVSNSDGTVAEQLRASGICQVGPGAAVSVRAILDSAVVGVAKPDPRIFAMALDALELDASEVAFVGDSVRFDVEPSAAVGLRPFHFDPLNTCSDDREHAHLSKLKDLATLV